ncbi:hypothetical protein L3Q82_009126 [Scortum barcoo]|uniref:Uncharacterized protein n=1 Tax=Scortum barcoo TaxID=214431 RepID=A0ACB8XBT4_9TELE|nr:hypothetical protein L3Q82_009126 [Scortum barcoo]
MGCISQQCSFLFPGWEGTLAGNVTWGLLRGGGGRGALCPILAAVVDDGHVSDMSAMIAVHQEGGGGGEAEFR